MTDKKRGLGRGLGALIPNAVDADRPVDVFFPSREQSAERDAAPKDPARSMRDGAASRRRGSAKTAEDPEEKPASSAAGESSRTTGTTKKSAPAKKSSAAKRGSTAAKKPASRSTETGRGTAAKADSAATSGATARSSTPDRESPAGTVATTSAAVHEVDGLLAVDGVSFGEIPLAEIRPNPRQPRDVFDEDALEELTHSVREIGVLQPIVVRQVSETSPRFEIIMGERRFRASTEAGREAIPAIVRATQDDDLLRDALLENIHRVDLNPLEEAAAYQQLLEDFGCTQAELSDRIGRSRPQISNTLRLLRLPPLVQRRVAAGVLSAGHARALLGLEDSAQVEPLAQRIVAEGLSVRATEEAVAMANKDETAAPKPTRQPVSHPELDALASRLGDRLDTRVSIAMGRRKGKLSVEFADLDDLNRVLDALNLDAAPE